MKKEIAYLGSGLLLSLNGLTSDGNILPSQVPLSIGLGLLVYGTYLMLSNHEKSKALKYVIPAWLIIIMIGIWTFSSTADGTRITTSDLGPPTNFQNLKTCEEARAKAEEDIKSGKLRYIFGSFGSRQPLAEKLKDKYEIEIIELEGVLGIPNECYNQVMYKEIQRKYGADVFTKK